MTFRSSFITRRQRLAAALMSVTVGLSSMMIGGSAIAGSADHGCQCGQCATASMDCPSCDCGCESTGKRKFSVAQTPLYKALDALAGGIERALFLDRDHHGKVTQCDDISGCDDACDAATLQTLQQWEQSPPLAVPQPIPIDAMPSNAVPSNAVPSDAVPVQPLPPNGTQYQPAHPMAPPAATPQPMRRITTPPEQDAPLDRLDPRANPFADDPMTYDQPTGSGLKPVRFDSDVRLKTVPVRQASRTTQVKSSVSTSRSTKSQRGGRLR
ncbi:hypothetical protein [Crateriforma conspicua]|uniref:Secreted protein n=1 Tax=Crateriforma conspicua TaxID=2527996 RepID=A0A5C6FTI9_9PLAN|nr:hypothetical protein [Crateriforma conspicua]TWU64818.1 hypothetical protein V7x_03620 [Crateriforma conspicua]